MKILTIIFSSIILVASSSYGKLPDPKSESDHKNHKKHDHSNQEAKLNQISKTKWTIKVNGMVCAFCAQGIEKNFKKKPEVKSVKVDLDKMEVHLETHPGKALNEKDIADVVTGAGFKFVGLK